MKENIFRVALTLAPVLVLISGAYFRHKQNQGKTVGGNISWPKAIWLAYTIVVWFFLPFAFYLIPISSVLCWGITAHLISWWLRGPLELVMIYKWYNWSPIYGITHDLLHFFMLLVVLWHGRPETWGFHSGLAYIFIGYLAFGTLAETFFAWLFYRIRGPEKKTVYFADNDPRWKFNNRVTAGVVIVVLMGLIFQAVRVNTLIFLP